MAESRSTALRRLSLTMIALAVFGAFAFDALQPVAGAAETVRIDAPADGASVEGRIDVRVTVAPTDPEQLDFYRIYVGNGRDPSAMRPLGPPRTGPVNNEVVATLDTTLLLAGEATIQLRMYPKDGDEIDATVVVAVQVGPTPTRVMSGPTIVVPPVAVGPQTTMGSTAPALDYPVSTVPDFELDLSASVARTPAPVQRLGVENIYDTLPGDPIQTDPILRDVGLTPVPIATPPLIPIPR